MNKLVVTTFNLNETLKYQFTKELTASATFGYSTNSAIRDEKRNLSNGIIMMEQ